MVALKPSIIITGGLGLIGKAVSKFLSEKDIHVIIIDIQPDCDLTEKNISYIQFDLMQINAYPLLVKQIQETTHNLKGIINNAAFNPKVEDDSINTGKFEDLDLASWNREMNLNLSAPVFLIKSLLGLFNHVDGKNCKIVNVISTYGLVPPNQDIYKELGKIKNDEIFKPIGYPVSKAGLAMATRYLSVYLGDQGFNVNGIAPGGIENMQPKEFVESYSRLTPMKRMGKVEEMLDTFYLLCSEGSNYINGQIIAVDGGWTTW